MTIQDNKDKELATGRISVDFYEQQLRLYLKRGVAELEQGHPSVAFRLCQQSPDFQNQVLTKRKTTDDVWDLLQQLDEEQECLSAAIEFFREGLQLQEQILTKGETSAGVWGGLLMLYFHAGLIEVRQGHYSVATSLCRKGLALLDQILVEGETSAEVWEGLLGLCHTAGYAEFQQGNYSAAAPLYQQGLAFQGQILFEGEPSAKMWGLLLGLHSNAVYAESQQGNYSAATSLYQQGLAFQDQALVKGETSVWMCGSLLWLYGNAVYVEIQKGNYSAATLLYRQGLALQDQTLVKGETSAWMWRSLLWLYRNAGHAESQQGHLPAAISHWQQGLDLGLRYLVSGFPLSKVEKSLEIFLSQLHLHAAGHKNLPHVRSLLLFTSFVANLADSGTFDNIYRNHVHGNAGLKDQIALEADTRKILCHFLLEYHDATLSNIPQWQRQSRLDLAANLLLLQQAVRNTRFIESLQMFNALPDSPAHSNCPLLKAAWQQFLPHQTLPVIWDDSALDHFKNVNFLSKLLHPIAWFQATTAIQIQQQLNQGTYPPPSAALLEDIQGILENLSRWLVDALLEKAELPQALESPGAVALGLLLAPSSTPAETLQSWRETPPWLEYDSLQSGFEAAGYTEFWNVINGRRPPLNFWTTHFDQLHLADHLNNTVPEELSTVMDDLDAGDPKGCQNLLDLAWEQACSDTSRLALLLENLANPNPAPNSCLDTILKEKPIKTPAELLSHPLGCTALETVINGQSYELLKNAVLDWLCRLVIDSEGQGEQTLLDKDQNVPPTQLISQIDPQTPLDRVLNGLKRAFDHVIAEHPGTTLHSTLAKRLHDWSSELLGEQLHAETLDIDLLWQLSEYERIGLYAQTVQPPSSQWKETTGTAINAAIEICGSANTYADWPVLTTWLECAEGLFHFKQNVSAERCQDNLWQGEALLQFIFDPVNGDLNILWLTKGQLEFIPLAENQNIAHWHQVLDLWKQLKLETTQPTTAESPSWEQLSHHPTVTNFLSFVSEHAAEKKCDHLIILYPALLGQLPLEALAQTANLWPIGFTERTVSLTRWRRTATTKEDLASPAGIFFDGEKGHLRYGDSQARAMAAALGGIPTPSQPDLTALDILQTLRSSRNGHLVFHGQFNPFSPQTSGLTLRRTAGDKQRKTPQHFMALWTVGASGLNGGTYCLSACEAALSGATTEKLMGVVGIAPAFVAAGATNAIGNLMKIHPVTAWMFWELMIQIQLESHGHFTFGANLEELVTLTRDRLRRLTYEDLDTLIRKRGSNPTPKEIRKMYHPLFKNPEYPFSHPCHWAGWVVFSGGESPEAT